MPPSSNNSGIPGSSGAASTTSDGSDGLPLWLPQLPAAIGLVVFAIALVHAALHYALTGESRIRDNDEALLVEPGKE